MKPKLIVFKRRLHRRTDPTSTPRPDSTIPIDMVRKILESQQQLQQQLEQLQQQLQQLQQLQLQQHLQLQQLQQQQQRQRQQRLAFLSKFPNEILTEIFSWIHPVNVLKFSRLAKRYPQLLLDPAFIRQNFLRNIDNQTHSTILKTEDFGFTVYDDDAGGRYLLPDLLETQQEYKAGYPCFKNLNFVWAKFWPEVYQKLYTEMYFDKIVDLDLVGKWVTLPRPNTFPDTGDSVLSVFQTIGPQLKSLTFNRCKIDMDCEFGELGLENLEILDFDRCDSLTSMPNVPTARLKKLKLSEIGLSRTLAVLFNGID
ncbi:UNVERIFIED_CONTAM: hypothetical protein HDU68_003272 [Siphonaria sp. JEL0065]|nr:hypothetical protein HDU68_003272 [Siphonaria sp. JEL0065]